jgi:hypothetical protein
VTRELTFSSFSARYHPAKTKAGHPNTSFRLQSWPDLHLLISTHKKNILSSGKWTACPLHALFSKHCIIFLPYFQAFSVLSAAMALVSPAPWGCTRRGTRSGSRAVA